MNELVTGSDDILKEALSVLVSSELILPRSYSLHVTKPLGGEVPKRSKASSFSVTLEW